jgi:hypothetical protein
MTNALVIMLALPEAIKPPSADTVADAVIDAVDVIVENISQVSVAVAVITATTS